MKNWQQFAILIYAFLNLGVFLKGYYECKFRKNSYGLAPYLIPLGVIAWGDAVIFGPFWIGTTIVSFLLNDWYLFLLIVSVFWVVRSVGETIYWFNQQFSTINRNPPQKLLFYSIFQNDSVWYVHQIIWQCISVISIIFSIYFAGQWLENL